MVHIAKIAVVVRLALLVLRIITKSGLETGHFLCGFCAEEDEQKYFVHG